MIFQKVSKTKENLKLMEIQMENYKKQSLVEKYGKINIVIVALCVIFWVINSVIEVSPH